MRHERGGSAGLFRCGKDTTWEGGLRVPAFLYFPAQVQPGITHQLTSTLDVTPTILALANISTGVESTHGFDLSPLFCNHSRVCFLFSPKHIFLRMNLRNSRNHATIGMNLKCLGRNFGLGFSSVH